MNIALCHESVLPVRGGCETYIASLARRLVADGREVHLYACRWDAAALPSNLRTHLVTIPPLPRFLRPWYFSRACQQALAQGRHSVSLGFDKIAGVDVIYPQGGIYAESLPCSLRKHRSAAVRLALTALRWLGPAHASFLALERRQMARPNSLIIAISDLVRRQVVQRYPAVAERTRILPIATDPTRIRKRDADHSRAARLRWAIPEDAVVALFAGMNFRLKGLGPLLAALAEVPGMVLLVAGGPAEGFQTLAARHGVRQRVRFLGYCEDMGTAYAAADVLVHPTFYDPCSNVVLEALACGLPVITTRYNGASEFLRPTGCGGECAEGYVIADPHDRAELAGRMRALLSPLRRAECARAAAETGLAWTFELHYQGLLDVLEEARQLRLDCGAGCLADGMTHTLTQRNVFPQPHDRRAG